MADLGAMGPQSGVEMRQGRIIMVITSTLLALAPVAASAQSPGPSTATPSAVAPIGSAVPTASAGPVASGPSAALSCEDMAGLLPPSVGAWPLSWAVDPAPTESVPGYPIAGLLGSLGVAADAVCKVTFDYGSNQHGVLIRFTGADPAGLLDAYVADAKAIAQTAGLTIQGGAYQIGERPGFLMGRPKDGVNYTALVYQLGDTVLEMTEPAMADAVVAHLPSAGAPLPVVTPPPSARSEPKGARDDCTKLFSLISGIPGVSGTSSVGPDAMMGNGFQAFPPPPAIISIAALDGLGIDVWDVCRMDFSSGSGSDASTGRLWKLGHGGATTLAAYLADVTATIQAAGGTVAQASGKLGGRTVSALTVTTPSGVTTWYYAPVGNVFVEIPGKAAAQQLLKSLPKAAKS